MLSANYESSGKYQETTLMDSIEKKKIKKSLLLESTSNKKNICYNFDTFFLILGTTKLA